MTATQAALAAVPRRAAGRRPLLLAVATVLALLTFCFQTTDNANVASRLATAESLVERHSFRIDAPGVCRWFGRNPLAMAARAVIRAKRVCPTAACGRRK